MEKQSEKQQKMRVIGLGLCRTGTFSLSQALGILGFGPSYHYMEHTPSVHEMRLWDKVAKVAPKDAAPYLEELFSIGNWPSAVDIPTSCFPEAMYESFPDAKFILTIRPIEKWLPSWEKCAHEFFRAYPCRWLSYRNYINFTTTKRLVYDGQYGGDYIKNALEVYQKHLEICKRVIPPEKLYIHRSEDGWQRLCDFLEVPVPDVPYPHANNAQALEEFVSNNFIYPTRIFFTILTIWFLAYIASVYQIFSFERVLSSAWLTSK